MVILLYVHTSVFLPFSPSVLLSSFLPICLDRWKHNRVHFCTDSRLACYLGILLYFYPPVHLHVRRDTSCGESPFSILREGSARPPWPSILLMRCADEASRCCLLIQTGSAMPRDHARAAVCVRPLRLAAIDPLCLVSST